jgi:DNA-binding PadR family transcriptional regulator
MIIISMLAGGPKNGVEMMDEVETMTRGFWRPSPGSIYPLLEQLVKEDLLKKREDGRYELTERANEEVEWSFGPAFRKPQTPQEMLDEIGGYVSYFEELNKTDRQRVSPHAAKMRELAERLAALGDPQDG